MNIKKNTAVIGVTLASVGMVIGTPASAEASAASKASVAIKFARAQIGDKYSQKNPQGPNHWDCSGLVRASFKQAGVKLPRVAQAQYSDKNHKLKSIAAKSRKPGDLVFFGGKNSIYHVGIYVGWKYRGKGGGWILHSPRPGKKVRIEKLWTKSVKYKRVK